MVSLNASRLISLPDLCIVLQVLVLVYIVALLGILSSSESSAETHLTGDGDGSKSPWSILPCLHRLSQSHAYTDIIRLGYVYRTNGVTLTVTVFAFLCLPFRSYPEPSDLFSVSGLALFLRVTLFHWAFRFVSQVLICQPLPLPVPVPSSCLTVAVCEHGWGERETHTRSSTSKTKRWETRALFWPRVSLKFD